MDEYLTVKEIAAIWGISVRRVSVLCVEGRVTGAKKRGSMWFIPKGSIKPSDNRHKNTIKMGGEDL